MLKLTEDGGKEIWYMQERNEMPLTLADITNDNMTTLCGAIIDADGTYYGLAVYGVHGVVAAMLHPELAKEFGIPQPLGRAPSSPYQEFEIACRYYMQSIRISCRYSIHISHGRSEAWPAEAQIETLRTWLIENNALDEKVITEGGSITGRKLLQKLRDGEQDPEHNNSIRLVQKKELEMHPDRYRPFDPSEWFA